MADTENMTRMKAILARHPEWRFTQPGGAEQAWEYKVSGPGLPDGGGGHPRLGALCNWLEAVERARMGPDWAREDPAVPEAPGTASRAAVSRAPRE